MVGITQKVRVIHKGECTFVPTDKGKEESGTPGSTDTAPEVGIQTKKRKTINGRDLIIIRGGLH